MNESRHLLTSMPKKYITPEGRQTHKYLLECLWSMPLITIQMGNKLHHPQQKIITKYSRQYIFRQRIKNFYFNLSHIFKKFIKIAEVSRISLLREFCMGFLSTFFCSNLHNQPSLSSHSSHCLGCLFYVQFLILCQLFCLFFWICYLVSHPHHVTKMSIQEYKMYLLVIKIIMKYTCHNVP